MTPTDPPRPSPAAEQLKRLESIAGLLMPCGAIQAKEDAHGNPCLFWKNPYNGAEEKIANFWWPSHPPEFTGQVEQTFQALWDMIVLLNGPALLRLVGAASSWQLAQSAEKPQGKDAFLTVIREWKLRWAASDDGGYRLAASYVDSNMMHDLAQALAERTAPPAAAVARLVEAARWACGLDAHHGCTCALCKALSDLEKQGGGNG